MEIELGVLGSCWHAIVGGSLSSKEFSKLLLENSMALSLLSILSSETCLTLKAF